MTDVPLPDRAGLLSQRRERLLLRGGIALCLAAAVAVRIVFLFHDSFATGFDGYYYALQVRSLVRNGEILNNDNSLVFILLRLFAIFSDDVVFTNKIAAVVLGSLTLVPVYLIAFRLTASHWAGFATALFFTLSFSQVYMSFEVLKNGVSVMFAAGCLWCLARFFDSGRHRLGAVVFFLLGFLTHKATAATLLALALVLFGIVFFQRRRTLSPRLRRAALGAAAAAVAALGIVIVLSVSPLRLIDLDNLSRQIDPASAVGRFRLFATQVSDVRIKIELFLLYAVPIVFIPFLVSRLRDKTRPPFERAFLAACYAAQWVLLNPFLFFSWESASYRLVLMSMIFSSLEIGLMLHRLAARTKKIIGPAAAGVLLAAALVTLPGMYARFHTDRYPDYRGWHAAVLSLRERLPAGSRLVCQAGLSFFIWYATDMYTEHFLPADPAGYYRLAFGLGPRHFERYQDDPDWEEPAAVRPGYTLVRESIWRRFYADFSGRLKILADWHNPRSRRPPFVYAVKPKFRTGAGEHVE